ncbi:DUF397 domain-containing protein [Amycolatopsis nigrescens]|uniref:DUF397 domain-containing protein n=1 Tax=Amycolatopsis nigrescens TaxID=381445 RepID=UPI00035D0431|nr:DUF397 domain-containing protein [Amycolatopsis nigrescens]
MNWQKSSYSGGGEECVEVALEPAEVGVRDTKDRDGGQLTFTPSAWYAFCHTLAPTR